MNNNFVINNNTRIIAKRGNEYLVTNDPNATIEDIFVKAVIINNNREIISPILPIGTLTKDGYWESTIVNEKKENVKYD